MHLPVAFALAFFAWLFYDTWPFISGVLCVVAVLFVVDGMDDDDDSDDGDAVRVAHA
jgi:hypothetical protein